MESIRYIGRIRSNRIRIPNEVFSSLGEPKYLHMVLTKDYIVLDSKVGKDSIPVKIYKKTYRKKDKTYTYVYLEIPEIILKVYRQIFNTKYYKVVYHPDTTQVILTLIPPEGIA